MMHLVVPVEHLRQSKSKNTIFATRPLFILPVSFDVAPSFLWICSAAQRRGIFLSPRKAEPISGRTFTKWQPRSMNGLLKDGNSTLSSLKRSKASVCEKCVQPLDVYIQMSETAQRFVVRSSETSGARVELFDQSWVKLARLSAVCAGIGNAKWKAIPTTKVRTVTTRVSPRRKMRWVTESCALGLVFEVFLLFSASPSVPHAFVLLPPASWATFSSWSWVWTGL